MCMDLLTDCISDSWNAKGPCIITGDFNCRSIDWINLTAPGDRVQDTLLTFLVNNGLYQMVEEPTRGKNILDIIICSEPQIVSGVEIKPPFSTSDHDQVEFCVFVDNIADCTAPASEAYQRAHYDWSAADYDSIAQYIDAIDWWTMLTTNMIVDSIWSCFREVLNSAIDMYVPKKTIETRPNKRAIKYPPGIRRAMARKRCLWRQRRFKPDDLVIRAAYKAAHYKCKLMIHRYEIKQEQKVIENNNTGSFYAFINKKLSCKKGVGALRDEQGNTIISDESRADLLNDYFSSVCTTDDGAQPTVTRAVPDSASIDSVNFTPLKVLTAIKKLKPSKSSGPDTLPSSLFKQLATALAGPLSIMYTTFMSVGRVPSEWTHAIVTPVFKGGDAADTSNYRPISLTSVSCKIMERIITTDLLHYLRAHNVISNQQHGFLSGKSTCTNLLETLNDWTLAVRDKKSIVVAYIDYSKAFDTVCHEKLLTKLSAYGIEGDLFKWIRSFLSNRSQQTRVGSCLSNVAYITSGVVQGSVLGPLLFLLFINDIGGLLSNERCVCKLYADDVKLYTTLQLDEDYTILQQKLDTLVAWSEKWQLTISHKKCAAMQISLRAQQNEVNLHLGNNTIKAVTEVKDLGITINNDLRYATYINQITANAHRRACLIHKCHVVSCHIQRYGYSETSFHNLCQTTAGIRVCCVVTVILYCRKADRIGPTPVY